MTDGSPIRPDPADGPTFEAPWQARAFALAVALTDERDLDWTRFQSRLVDEIEDPPDDGADSDEDYYRRWLAALERLLVEEELLAPGELRERVAAFADGDRTAHEFVDGDPRGHVDRLPADHAEGSGHDHGHGDGDGHSHSHGHDH